MSQVLDITEHKKADDALNDAKDELERRVRQRTEELQQQVRVTEHERDRLMTLIESMTDGVWFIDAQGHILLANHVAKEHSLEIGLEPETLYGPTSAALLAKVDVTLPDGKPWGWEMLPQIIEGEPLRQKEVRVRNRAGGPTFYRRISANAVKDKEGRIAGAVVVVQDVTAQKRAETEGPGWRSGSANRRRWRPWAPSPGAWPTISTTCLPWCSETPSWPSTI